MNAFTGTVHNPDGSREFEEGGKVGGVNLWLGMRADPPESKKDVEAQKIAENDTPLGEADAKKKELKKAKEDAKKTDADNKKKEEKEAAKRRAKRLNPFTGTVHNPDGSREFEEGGTVGGVNKWIGTPHQHHRRHHRSVAASVVEIEPLEAPSSRHSRSMVQKSKRARSRRAHKKRLHALRVDE
jgi:hypothetical protein